MLRTREPPPNEIGRVYVVRHITGIATKYDYREALEHVERLRDWYTADPDSGDIEVPGVEGSIPACMRKNRFRGGA
jgi:hypothetical protein